ncbi:gag-protease polyprotein, partial [Trifolium pratense]
MDKEGGLVTRPPLLVGASNYDYWKSRMMAFLKQIDSKTWKAVLRGWAPPVKMDKDGKPSLELKREEEWSKEEDELALANSKALYALYNGVDKHIFRLIKKCVSAKEAWNILETVHEGTSKVKMSRLLLLTTKFENLRMNDDETIQEFHMTLLDYDNQFDALGEKIPEEKLVRKMLRSLPKKFDMKVTAIEEAKDITEMKLDELVDSLQTYEVATNERMDKKYKSIAFVSNAEEEDQQSDTESESSISNEMVLLGKQFNKVLKRMDKRPRTSVADTGRNTYRNFRKPTTDEKTSLNKGVQCHECEGYGHIRTECATFLKKQKKGLTVSWSDEDFEGEADTTKSIHALTGVCTSDTESCDEELTFVELAESYRELCLKSEEVCRVSEKQKETVTKLQTERTVNLSKISEIGIKCEESLKTIEEQKATIISLETDKVKQLAEIAQLNEEVTELNSHLENLKKCVLRLFKGTNLDEILETLPTPSRSKTGIG